MKEPRIEDSHARIDTLMPLQSTSYLTISSRRYLKSIQIVVVLNFNAEANGGYQRCEIRFQLGVFIIYSIPS